MTIIEVRKYEIQSDKISAAITNILTVSTGPAPKIELVKRVCNRYHLDINYVSKIGGWK